MEQSTNNNGYLEVTQDGIARITSSTADNIQGIYTEGLETCLAIIIVGKQSSSIIHATHKLSVQSIQNESKQHEIRFWTIAYTLTILS